MKIVFMGTPDFAVSTLDAIHQSHHEVVAVVTTVDQMGGRGRNQLIQSDVKKYAVENGIPLMQPKRLKSEKFLAKLKSFNADLFVVVAFRMLPEIVWAMPPKGTINLHGSLLPKYRGAAPINWAVINGESETGVTTFFIEKEIDTGNILLQNTVQIGEEDTFGEVYNKLKVIGAELVIQTLDAIENNSVIPQKQRDELSSEAPKIFLETGRIDETLSVNDAHNLVRGLHPFPNGWIKRNNLTIKIIKTSLQNSIVQELPNHLNIGDLVVYNKKLFLVCKDGLLMVLEIKPEGKKLMSATDYINGQKDLSKIEL